MSYHTDAHRAYYKSLRKATKAPVIIVIKAHLWGWYAETKEGLKLFEQKNCCCAWCAKAEAIEEWIKMKEV